MISSLTAYMSRLIGLPKIQTDLLWYLTFLFCGLGMAYFVFVFFFRNRMSKRAKKVSEKKRELAPMISQFLFIEEDASKEEREHYLNSKVEIRQRIKSGFDRTVLAEMLMDLQKDVSGEARQRLYELYKGLDLHQDAFAKLKSWRWEVISKGILELTQMRVEEAYMFIRRFINHRRGVIRKQAQVATVTLKHEGISYFLDTCRYRISEWQQLKLLDVIRHLEGFEPPRFKVWLTSKNPDVVLFALRLIRYYSQNDANRAIIQLIKHRNAQIKLEAIQCLKLFGVAESIQTLKSSFLNCNTDVKIAILDAIGALGDSEDIDFLRKIEHSHENFIVKSKALTAINTIDPSLILPQEDIQEPESQDIEFVKDEVVAANQEQESITVMDEVVPENEEKAEMPKIPELETENEEIFELCFQEELQDIIEESSLEEEPEYLPLDFLPLVEESISLDEAPESDELNPEPENVEDEEKFKKDLDTILNQITMKQDRKPKIKEELPEFIPLVVSNEEDENSAAADNVLELEVEAEFIGVKKDQPDSREEAENEFSPSGKDLDKTEVDRSPLTWEDLLDAQDPGTKSEMDPSLGESDELTEDLLGFSIFQEMFRDFDAESKLIILDEILVVGEEKELRFLETLSKDPDKKVRQKARKIKEKLAQKLQLSLVDETSESDWDPSPSVHAVEVEANYVEAESPEPQPALKETKKMPLEFCFYNDVEGISEEELVPDFEPDISDVRPTETKVLTKAEAPKRKSSGLLENLLAFTMKLRERRNG